MASPEAGAAGRGTIQGFRGPAVGQHLDSKQTHFLGKSRLLSRMLPKLCIFFFCHIACESLS